LGKVAGLGGIALGVVVLLIRPIIGRITTLPRADRAPILRLIAGGAFGIGALGIAAWLVGGFSGGNVTSGTNGVAIRGNVSGSTITTNAPGTPPAGATPNR
jgi:hypothetical protein